MRVRALSCTLAVLFAALFGAAAAAETAKDQPFHVFMVVWRGETDVEHGFRAHMRERGIRVRYTLRDLGRDRSRIPGIVDEIRAVQPDLVHTWGTSTTLGVLGPREGAGPGAHVEGIPGVFSLVAYPIQAGIVESFPSTGRAVTGTAFLPPIETQLEAIRAYRDFDRLGVIYNPLERNSVLNVEDLRGAAASRAFELLESPVPLGSEGKPDAEELPGLVDDLKERGADFIYMGPDSFVGINSAAITTAAATYGIPVFAGTELAFDRSGAMLGLVSRYYLVGKLAGAQAERILVGGERPEDIPVASLARFTLLIRMPVALELGIYPPLGLLRIAQVVD